MLEKILADKRWIHTLESHRGHRMVICSRKGFGISVFVLDKSCRVILFTVKYKDKDPEYVKEKAEKHLDRYIECYPDRLDYTGQPVPKQYNLPFGFNNN